MTTPKAANKRSASTKSATVPAVKSKTVVPTAKTAPTKP